ncbi:Cytochrome P450 71B26, partial [Cucurbita argyrosperma subsp. sororia]
MFELLNASRVQSFQDIREEEVGLLLNSISEHSNLVDLCEKSYSLTANIITRMAFGKNFRGGVLDNHNFHHVVRRAIATSQKEDNIIDVLLKSEKDGLRLSRDCIKALTMNIFLGGVDTGAGVIVWAMAELIRNPSRAD